MHLRSSLFCASGGGLWTMTPPSGGIAGGSRARKGHVRLDEVDTIRLKMIAVVGSETYPTTSDVGRID